MATKTEAYLDTSALIAFLDRSDSYHPLFRRLFSSPPALVTSALVVAEGHGWFLRRYDRNRATQFLNFIDALSVLDIQSFDTEELTKTSGLIRKFGDQSLTLADAHGLVIIKERRISTCWSTDRHLALTGAKLVASSASP
jgi:predicted nucleic acid-binding protein